MKLLLDTHALVWWLDEGQRLSANARRAISDPSASVHVSAASAYELSLKHALGKFPEADKLVRNWSVQIEQAGFLDLGISASHAIRAGALPRHHRDPFDRLLIASAVEDGLTLVTNDAAIARYDVETYW